jgi:hypothetical protein
MHYSPDYLRGVLKDTWWDTYRDDTAVSPMLSSIMGLGVPSDKRYETYGYPESQPVVKRWDKGKPIPTESGRAVSYRVRNLRWGMSFPYDAQDIDDMVVGNAKAWIRELAGAARTLPERVFFQLVAAATNPDLLPSLPLAPDGVGLFSATDGAGSARFGRTGGNSLTGSGFGTAQAVFADAQAALAQIRMFRGTKGEPLRTRRIDRVLVLYSPVHEETVAAAFRAPTVLRVEGGGSGGVSNMAVVGSTAYELWADQRVPSNRLVIHAAGSSVPPVFQQSRTQPDTREWDDKNSHVAFQTGQNSFDVFVREGYGVNLPHSTVLVTS